MEKLRLNSQIDLESDVSAAVKRHRDEEITLVKVNLAKIVNGSNFHGRQHTDRRMSMQAMKDQ